MASIRKIGASALIWQSATLLLVYLLNFVSIPAAGWSQADYNNAAKMFQFFGIDHPMFMHVNGWLQLIFAGTLVSTALGTASTYHRADSAGAAHVRAYGFIAAAIWAISGTVSSMTVLNVHYGMLNSKDIATQVFNSGMSVAWGIESAAIFFVGLYQYQASRLAQRSGAVNPFLCWVGVIGGVLAAISVPLSIAGDWAMMVGFLQPATMIVFNIGLWRSFSRVSETEPEP